MTTQDWPSLAAALSDTLHLSAPPLAITFSDAPLDGVPMFDEPMPEPMPDGRTGRVPAGCVFWMKAADRTFGTVAEDHGNCSVGSVTHGFKTLEEVGNNSDVAALLESGWVTMDVVPQIPVVHEKPGAVTYGPLAETPVDPDVVFVRVTGRQMMVLSDAIPGSAHRGQAPVPHRRDRQGRGRPRGQRGLRAQPRAHRHVAHRDDVRDPGVEAGRDRRVGAAARGRRQHRRQVRRRRRDPVLESPVLTTSWRPRSTGCRRTSGR